MAKPGHVIILWFFVIVVVVVTRILFTIGPLSKIPGAKVVAAAL